VKNHAHSEQFRIYEDSKTPSRIAGELQGGEDEQINLTIKAVIFQKKALFG